MAWQATEYRLIHTTGEARIKRVAGENLWLALDFPSGNLQTAFGYFTTPDLGEAMQRVMERVDQIVDEG